MAAKSEFEKVVALEFPMFIEYRFAKDALALISSK